MQRQAIVKVRLVIDKDTTLDDAVDIVVNALEEVEVMAHVVGVKTEEVEDGDERRT